MEHQHDHSELIRKALQSVPLPPRAVRELLRISQQADVDMQRIIDTITSDEALTARVIRVVNSALFGMKRQISSVQQATVLLGRGAIVQMAVGVAALHTETAVPADLPLSRQAFWRHSMSTAFLARHVATSCGEADAEKAFTAGLLHDIGKLVLMGYLGPEYTFVLQRAQEEQRPLYRVERDMLGADHDDIGRELCDKWKLSTSLREAASLHRPDAGADRLNRIVQAANAAVKAAGVGESGNPHVHLAQLPQTEVQQTARNLGFIRELPHEVSRIERAFRSGGGDDPEGEEAAPTEATKGTIFVQVQDATLEALVAIALCGLGFAPERYPSGANGNRKTRGTEVLKADLVGGVTDEAPPQSSEVTWLDVTAWQQARLGATSGTINVAALRAWLDRELGPPQAKKA
ncbi:MAG: HDOD domain-containing protein [Bacteroidetes bacterium]|jgi:putative nucleotidyltransferase with HDIG domain|nr:HDOD domain-containing protein [Bacteroidota bacterium]